MQSEPEQLNIVKIGILVLAAYALLAIAFYFLAGDQLRFRTSRGSIAMLPADSGTAELSEGTLVEQHFHAKIQRFTGVSVQWSVYYQVNAGDVHMQLARDNGEVLLERVIDAATIAEGETIPLVADFPMENVYDKALVLRLFADSRPGSAVKPLMNAAPETEEGFSLCVNGEEIPGRLCFTADGTDYIWTGLHYWKFAAALGALIALAFFVINKRYQSGKHSYVVDILLNIRKYRFLIRQLVGRDFKAKYKRSVLGILWSFLNPLLMMLVQYFVFSTIFKSDIPNYAAYLITGTVMFNFFTESCGMTLNSILGNSGLLTKVYMPKYIYPLTSTLSSVVNLMISLIPMLIVCILTGVRFQKSAPLALFFYVCLIIFALGMGMALATSMAFFRDTQFLWGVLSLMWMYWTPIFYPETILADNLRVILQLNPMYHFLKNARMCILGGLSPEPKLYFQCLAIAVGMLVFGIFVFNRNQDKFVLYL